MPTSMSIVPSSTPWDDANSLLKLFPGKFILESSSSSAIESINDGKEMKVSSQSDSGKQRRSRTGKASRRIEEEKQGKLASFALLTTNKDQVGRIEDNDSVLIFVERSPVKAFETTVPNATLLLDGPEFKNAISSIQKEGSDLDIRVNELSPMFATIQLSGGATVLLVLRSFVSESSGRKDLITILTKKVVDRTARNSLSLTSLSETKNGVKGMMISRPSLSSLSDIEGNDVDASTDNLSASGDQKENRVAVSSLDQVPPPPPFSTLSVKLLGNKKEPSLQINSRKGIPLETDMFVGRVLFLLKPENSSDDPYYHERLFSTKKRRFEIRIQGRFKYVPKNTLFCGLEITEQMKMGLVSKGLCNILLKFVGTIASGMHYSFGDKNDTEWPHIVFPAWTFFDTLVVTPADKTPPPIEEEFPEPTKAALFRKASGKSGDWKLDHIYSMSFYSMYLDLPSWTVVKLPMMQDVDLRRFWSNSALRIVLYEKSDSSHNKELNKYLCGVQIQFIEDGVLDGGSDNTESDNAESESTESENTESDNAGSDNAGSDNAESDSADDNAPIGDYRETTNEALHSSSHSGRNMKPDTDEAKFFDAVEELPSLLIERNSLSKEHFQVPFKNDEQGLDSLNSKNGSFVLSADNVCPAWVDFHTAHGKRSTFYAVAVLNNTDTVFRKAKSFAPLFAEYCSENVNPSNCSPRASTAERTREYLGSRLFEAMRNPLCQKSEKYKALSKKTHRDLKFLRSDKIPSPSFVKGTVAASSLVARAQSDHHWIEEWGVIADKHVSFFHSSYKKSSFRILRQAILAVRHLDGTAKPNLPGFYFLQVETLGRTTYLMFRCSSLRTQWLMILTSKLSDARHLVSDVIQRLGVSNELPSISSKTGCVDETDFDNPEHDFLHKSTQWKCHKRRILNCRRFCFNTLDQAKDGAHPCDMVKSTLRKALALAEENEVNNLCSFLDSASQLKSVDVRSLDEAEKLTFFLNLYHIMVMHAFVVLGPPTSAFKWLSYFNMISYQCSNDIFSLTELEHCVIRGNMSTPSQFLSKFAIPSSEYSFALKRSDYRINFALNCGSLSNPKCVPLYKVDSLDEQLNEATRLYLTQSVEIDSSSKKGVVTVTLPRICHWYAADFGRGRQSDIIRCVKDFLNLDDQILLTKCLDEEESGQRSHAYCLKYLKYDFTCRHLTLA